MSLNEDEKPMSLQEVANQLHAEYDNRKLIEALSKEFNEEIEELKRSHDEHMQQMQEAHDKEIFELKQEFAHIKPMVDAYYQKDAAFEYGKRIGNNVTWIGGVFAVVAAACVAAWHGFKYAVAEAAKNADKIPPVPPPGIGN